MRRKLTKRTFESFQKLDCISRRLEMLCEWLEGSEIYGGVGGIFQASKFGISNFPFTFPEFYELDKGERPSAFLKRCQARINEDIMGMSWRDHEGGSLPHIFCKAGDLYFVASSYPQKNENGIEVFDQFEFVDNRAPEFWEGLRVSTGKFRAYGLISSRYEVLISHNDGKTLGFTLHRNPNKNTISREYSLDGLEHGGFTLGFRDSIIHEQYLEEIEAAFEKVSKEA